MKDLVVAGQKRKFNGSRKPSTSSYKKIKQEALLKERQRLPIWSQREAICNKLLNHDILLLVGETGSGKSTQLPQFLLQEQSWCSKAIAVTQPRRVAAISLAQRVAEELGTTLGKQSPASKVGYSVRFDQNVAPACRIKYLTDGMLVNEMLVDPWLSEYSCVVVDEVHERSVNCDLILGFLRRIIEDDQGCAKHRRGQMLKIVIMSATVDTDPLRTFFERKLSQDGEDGAEDSWSGINSDVESDDSEEKSMLVAEEYVPGRQYSVTTTYLERPAEDVYDEATRHVIAFHTKEPLPGDILVFMTGQEDVESVRSLVEEKAASLPSNVPKLLTLPLYAALGPSQQRAVFESTPKNVRKVIISTNIAESSVTIPGIRIVIDNGLVKVKEHRNALGLDSLLVKPISKSAAIQRQGRAGREGPGKCSRLYTEKSYLELEQDNKPEILRSDLAGTVLTMKARGIDDVIKFPFLDPPSKQSLQSALLQLLRLNALGNEGKITKLGREMARLPLPPALSRVLVSASESSNDKTTEPHDSLPLAIIDIISALVSEPFFQPTDAVALSHTNEEGDSSRLDARTTLHRRQGDHLTYLAAIRSFSCEKSDRKLWAHRHLVNHRAMKSVLAVRKQLRAMLIAMKLLSPRVVQSADEIEDGGQDLESERSTWLHPADAMAERVIRCFLRGFAPNVARLCKDAAYRTVESNQVVRVHPASVMAGRKTEAIVYTELVFTRRNYARGVSAAQLQWYADAMEFTIG